MWSLSARRAWIEMHQSAAHVLCSFSVALRKESVDRNKNFKPEVRDWFKVALRKESVDRNGDAWIGLDSSGVALRKESVDRNIMQGRDNSRNMQSLSARRAWIEIIMPDSSPAPGASLSARRAWIEILRFCGRVLRREVALRKESVDRNV